MSAYRTRLLCKIPEVSDVARTKAKMTVFPAHSVQEKVFMQTIGTNGKRTLRRGACLGHNQQISRTPNREPIPTKIPASRNSFHPSPDVEKFTKFHGNIRLFFKSQQNGRDRLKTACAALPSRIDACRQYGLLVYHSGTVPSDGTDEFFD